MNKNIAQFVKRVYELEYDWKYRTQHIPIAMCAVMLCYGQPLNQFLVVLACIAHTTVWMYRTSRDFDQLVVDIDKEKVYSQLATLLEDEGVSPILPLIHEKAVMEKKLRD